MSCAAWSWTLSRWHWLAVCVVAGQIIPRTGKGADGLTAFQRAFRRASHPQAMPAAWGVNIFVLESEQKRARRRFRSQTSFWTVSSWASRKVLRSSLWEYLLVVWFAELSKDGRVRMQQNQSFSTASVEHPGDCCQRTNHENQESNRCESMYALCMLTFFLQSTNHDCNSEKRGGIATLNVLSSILRASLAESLLRHPVGAQSYLRAHVSCSSATCNTTTTKNVTASQTYFGILRCNGTHLDFVCSSPHVKKAKVM